VFSSLSDSSEVSSFGPKGSWAVVTGASDGIGKEYALQLAQKGFNILLVSRTQSKLDALSSQITSSSQVKAETLSIDFSNPSESDYSKLAKAVQGKQIAILINNVGQSHSIPVAFAETTNEEMTNIIKINCLATLRVTQTVLPSMLPNKKGLILTMGSFGGLTPTPYLATYSGSKAFLQQWSTALASELAPEGITVHFVHSYLVTSAMSKIRRANWQVPSEKAFVRSALSKIGRRGGSVGYSYSGTPYWSHAFVAALITGVLGPFNSALLSFNRKMHVDIRKRALRKAERDKAKGKKES
jgi:17beta-estradiol 17-dehydrogenase / very-long-chain 3-oxoacyl-CoA reductase